MLSLLALLPLSAAFMQALAPVRPALLQHSAHRPAPLMMSAGEWNSDDDNALRRQIQHSTSRARLGPPDDVMQGLTDAWVLIFNPGKQDEGVYTLQGRNARASAYVLAFEYPDDADRFANLLQAEGFDLPTPHSWDHNQLNNFCSTSHFEVSLVPSGALITPPTKNEFDMDAFSPRARNRAVEAQRRFWEAKAAADGGRPGYGPGDADVDPPQGEKWSSQWKQLESTLSMEAEDCGVEEGCEMPDEEA